MSLKKCPQQAKPAMIDQSPPSLACVRTGPNAQNDKQQKQPKEPQTPSIEDSILNHIRILMRAIFVLE